MAYTDCYAVELGRAATLAEFVEAFYTGGVFRIERWLLRWLVSRPSTDAQARDVAAGRIDRFAAWDVEDRRQDQLLMCDLHGRTRSWFMVSPLPTGGTRLYFGSAVVPRQAAGSTAPDLGPVFRALLGFHRVYSRVLLGAARSRLRRATAVPPAALVKIAFTDDRGDVETLWALDLGNGRYQLDSTPWYQYGVSYQDVVAASLRDGQLHFEGILSKSGIRTVRVRSEASVPQALLADLVALGCKYEGARAGFIGIDVPPGVDLAVVASTIGASGLEWEYADPTHEQLFGPV